MDVKFLQIAKHNILAHWSFWQKDLELICGDKYTNGQESLEGYLNFLIHPDSRAIFWAGFIDGKYAGFAITVPDGDHLLVHSAKTNRGNEIFKFALETVEKYAKERGFRKIKFITKRDKAFAKKMEPQGYKPEQTIFYKEV